MELNGTEYELAKYINITMQKMRLRQVGKHTPLEPHYIKSR